MYLIQIFLPVFNKKQIPFPKAVYSQIQKRMLKKFGGITLYSRAGIEGLWGKAGHVEADQMIIAEIMVNKIESSWWKKYKERLEKQFAQDEILMRYQETFKI